MADMSDWDEEPSNIEPHQYCRNDSRANEKGFTREPSSISNRPVDGNDYNRREDQYEEDWEDEGPVRQPQKAHRTHSRPEQTREHTCPNSYTGSSGRNCRQKENSNHEEWDDDDYNHTQVPTDKVGLLIGRGGAKIKELQGQTNTNIKVIKNVAESAKTRVFVGGDPENVSEAIRMIKEITKDRHSYENAVSKSKHEPSRRTAGRTINWGAASLNSEQRNKERLENMEQIVKEFYNESTHIANLSDQDVQQIRLRKNQITVSDKSEKDRKIPNPILGFADAFGNYREIMLTLEKAAFKEPSPIQCQAWPIVLSGHDLIGIAQTGTGKTLAFLLPALVHIDGQKKPRQARQGPTCLILSPTRELAQQIEQEVQKFNYKGIRSVCIYGGGNRSKQIGIVERGVEIVIATPGRLNDLIQNDIITLIDVTFLVLDEADRMLDMGFEPEIRKVLLDVRPDRQTIMTSATWPSGIARMVRNYMTDPFQVNVGSLNLTACKNVEQRIEFVEAQDKLHVLIQTIQGLPPNCKVLVFVGRKITADHVTSELVIQQVCDGAIQCIHGDREQVDREEALDEFKTGKARVLIATDVASRGLDICDINCVINFDFPRQIEDYVHRIGRTGRARRFGFSISFICREDWAKARPLIDILKDSKAEIPDELVFMAERFEQKQREKEISHSSEFRGSGDNMSRRSTGVRLCRLCGKPGHLSKECTRKFN